MSITDRCFDTLPHRFLQFSQDPSHVFCMKCLTVLELASPTPIPPDPDPGNGIVFRPSGGDDTALLQSVLDSLGTGARLLLAGIAVVSATLWLRSKAGVSIGVLGGGGFQATAAMNGPNRALLVADHCAGLNLSSLEWSLTNQQAGALFLDTCAQTSISHVNIHDAGAGATSAIGGRVSNGVTIDSSTCINTGDEVRGFWIGTGNDFCRNVTMTNNTLRNIGHTALIAEGESIRIAQNNVSQVQRHGSCVKVCARGAVSDITVESNGFTDAYGGVSIEGTGVKSRFFVEANTAARMAQPGTSFGFLYVSGAAGTWNLLCHGNTVSASGCFGATQFLQDSQFRDNVVLNGNGSLNLEESNRNVDITTAYPVNLGNNNSDIWVNGKQVA